MDILLNSPRDIPVTLKEFYHFSYMDLSCFFINWPVCISKGDNGELTLWTISYDSMYICMDNHRFKGITWYVNESTGVYSCAIPEGPLNTLLRTKFNHLFLK